MEKNNKNKKRIAIILSTIGILLIGTLGWLIYSTYIATYPLGNKLEYIGKTNYGCWWVCDADPASTYYYATDMDTNQIKSYFHAAKFDQEPRTIGTTTDFSLLSKNNKIISIHIYKDKQDENLTWRHLQNSNKKYIVSIPSFNYPAAKDSL